MPDSLWESNQGSFILVVDISHFMPVDELCQAVDRYVAEVRAMEPLPGSDEAEVAGGVEWRWEQENRRERNSRKCRASAGIGAHRRRAGG